MVKSILLGIAVFVFSFFVATGVIHAQNATTTPTPTMSAGGNSSTPGAPNTGFGH